MIHVIYHDRFGFIPEMQGLPFKNIGTSVSNNTECLGNFIIPSTENN